MELNLEDVRKRIVDCSTYNFGMYNANKLAHDDAPALLSCLETAEAQLARVREFSRGHDDKYVMMGIQEALDGDPNECE